MRWYALIPVVIIVGYELLGGVESDSWMSNLGCKLFDGGVSGSWSSSNGLKADLMFDRTWTGTYQTGFSRVNIRGRWEMHEGNIRLIPVHWTAQNAFAGMGSSGSNNARSEGEKAIQAISKKTFVLSKEGKMDVLKDTSPGGNQTMYRILE